MIAYMDHMGFKFGLNLVSMMISKGFLFEGFGYPAISFADIGEPLCV